MKKRLMIFMLIALLAIGMAFPASADEETYYEPSFIYDSAGILLADEVMDLDQMAYDTFVNHGCAVYIITIDDYTDLGYGDDIDFAAENVLGSDDYPAGIGEGANYILLLLSLNDRDYAISVLGEKAEAAFGDYARSKLADAFLPQLADDNWSGAFETYISTCNEYLTLAENGEPVEKSPVSSIIIAVLVSCAVALIVCLILKSKMKTVHHKTEAREYVSPGGLNLTGSYDTYTGTTRTSRTIETSSGSSGSSGGSSSGKF